jgi:hypothetical protein
MFASAQTACQISPTIRLLITRTSSETPVCDVYIYYFVMSNHEDGDNMLSTRPAALETIKDRGGAAIMESQMVVDHTELDGDGFLGAAVGCDSHEINDTAAQISSLEVRAASRDNEAISSTDEIAKYMLSLESRELRKQARVLKSRRTEIVAGEGFRTDASDFIHFGASLAI